MGIYPFTINSPEGRLNYSLLYIILLMAIWSGGAFLAGYKRIASPIAPLTMLEKCLDGLYSLLSVTLFFALTVNNIRHPNAKIIFSNKLTVFDEKCFIRNNKKCIMWSLLRYISGHAVYPLLAIADFKSWRNFYDFNQLFLLSLPVHIGMFYEVFIVAFLWEFATVVESRYKFLKFKLSTLLMNNSMNHPILIQQVNEIQTLYTLLYEAVKQINRVFGSLLLIIFSHMVLLFLLNICWLVTLKPGLKIDLILLGLIAYPVCTLVSKPFILKTLQVFEST